MFLIAVGFWNFLGAGVIGFLINLPIDFFMQPAVRVFERLRLPGDVLFIVGGIFPIVYLALRMFAGRNRPGHLAPDSETEAFTRAGV